MSWVYDPSTGQLFAPWGTMIETGYSGTGEGRNNPAMQFVKNVGPIPEGTYIIGAERDDVKLGPYAMPLFPCHANTEGRSGFYIHGDNVRHDASHGCIILSRATRERIADSGDHVLKVLGMGTNA